MKLWNWIRIDVWLSVFFMISFIIFNSLRFLLFHLALGTCTCVYSIECSFSRSFGCLALQCCGRNVSKVPFYAFKQTKKKIRFFNSLKAKRESGSSKKSIRKIIYNLLLFYISLQSAHLHFSQFPKKHTK